VIVESVVVVGNEDYVPFTKRCKFFDDLFKSPRSCYHFVGDMVDGCRFRRDGTSRVDETLERFARSGIIGCELDDAVPVSFDTGSFGIIKYCTGSHEILSIFFDVVL
jgi:hypothetical protein